MPASTAFYWSFAAALLLIAGVLWLLSGNTPLGLLFLGLGALLGALAFAVRRSRVGRK